ncbi:MAG: HEAT repeat domain-containing protein [Methylotetracoccus sp.]
MASATSRSAHGRHLSGAILLLLACRTSSAETAYQIDLHDQRVTLNARGALLVDVLRGLAERTGTTISGIELLCGTTDAEFTELSLSEALQRLLPGARYSFDQGSGASARHPRLSIQSFTPDSATSATPDPVPSAEALAAAGYVPDQYKKLYAWAERGDLTALQGVVANGDPTARSIAIRLLAAQDPERAARLAARDLRDGAPGNRIDAVQTLGEIDSERSTKALALALDDGDLSVRQTALLALNSQSSAAAIELLSKALGDRDTSIRMTALDLLAERGPGSTEGIRSALQDPDARVQDHARRLLAQLSAGADAANADPALPPAAIPQQE